jgi:hypothetical protein
MKTVMSDFVVKTSDLDAEFKISKNTRVTRLAMVGLHPDRLHKEGKSYWLTQDQYDLFVDFDKYIQDTGSTKDYPHLFVNCGESLAQSRESAEDGGELATVAAAKIERTPESFEVETVTETFATGVSPAMTADKRLAAINEKAQNRAAAMLLAESILAERYIQNPDSLPPNLRAQIDAVPMSVIDPKELAASLVRGVEAMYGAA